MPNELNDETVLQFTFENRIYEVPATCPHRGAPLHEATQAGPYLRCAWHGATFDLRTGRLIRGPQCPDLKSIDVTPETARAKELSA